MVRTAANLFARDWWKFRVPLAEIVDMWAVNEIYFPLAEIVGSYIKLTVKNTQLICDHKSSKYTAYNV